jgi:hypothetical protein
MRSAPNPPVSAQKAQQNNDPPLCKKAKREAQSDPKIKTIDFHQNAQAANSQYETHYEQQLAHESVIFAKMQNAKVPLVPASARGALAPLQTSAAMHAQVLPVFGRAENALQLNDNQMCQDQTMQSTNLSSKNKCLHPPTPSAPQHNNIHKNLSASHKQLSDPRSFLEENLTKNLPNTDHSAFKCPQTDNFAQEKWQIEQRENKISRHGTPNNKSKHSSAPQSKNSHELFSQDTQVLPHLVHSTQQQKQNQVPNEITASALTEKATKIYLASSRAALQHEQSATYATENSHNEPQEKKFDKKSLTKIGLNAPQSAKTQKPMSTSTLKSLDFCRETKSAEKMHLSAQSAIEFTQCVNLAQASTQIEQQEGQNFRQKTPNKIQLYANVSQNAQAQEPQYIKAQKPHHLNHAAQQQNQNYFLGHRDVPMCSRVEHLNDQNANVQIFTPAQGATLPQMYAALKSVAAHDGQKQTQCAPAPPKYMHTLFDTYSALPHAQVKIIENENYFAPQAHQQIQIFETAHQSMQVCLKAAPSRCQHGNIKQYIPAQCATPPKTYAQSHGARQPTQCSRNAPAPPRLNYVQDAHAPLQKTQIATASLEKKPNLPHAARATKFQNQTNSSPTNGKCPDKGKTQCSPLETKSRQPNAFMQINCNYLNGQSPKYCQDGPSARSDTYKSGNFVHRLSNFPLVDEQEIKSNLQMRLNNIKIQPFTGTNDPINPFTFLYKLQKLAEDHEIDLFTLVKDKMPSTLQGDAKQWWNQIGITTCSWHEFAQQFIDKFSPPINQENITKQINPRAQEPNEPLLAYIHTISTMCKSIDPQIKDDEVIQIILNKMHPKYRLKLAGWTGKTLSELEKTAREEQNAHLNSIINNANTQADNNIQPTSKNITNLKAQLQNKNKNNKTNEIDTGLLCPTINTKDKLKKETEKLKYDSTLSRNKRNKSNSKSKNLSGKSDQTTGVDGFSCAGERMNLQSKVSDSKIFHAKNKKKKPSMQNNTKQKVDKKSNSKTASTLPDLSHQNTNKTKPFRAKCNHKVSKPYIAIKIGNIERIALLDTGSDVNIIGEKLFREFSQTNKNTLLNSKKQINMLTGSIITIGAIKLDVKWKYGKVQDKFLALKDNTDQIILGMPFISKVGMKISAKGWCTEDNSSTVGFAGKAGPKQPSNAKAFVKAPKSTRPLNADKMEDQQNTDIPKLEMRSKNAVNNEKGLNSKQNHRQTKNTIISSTKTSIESHKNIAAAVANVQKNFQSEPNLQCCSNKATQTAQNAAAKEKTSMKMCRTQKETQKSQTRFKQQMQTRKVKLGKVLKSHANCRKRNCLKLEWQNTISTFLNLQPVYEVIKTLKFCQKFVTKRKIQRAHEDKRPHFPLHNKQQPFATRNLNTKLKLHEFLRCNLAVQSQISDCMNRIKMFLCKTKFAPATKGKICKTSEKRILKSKITFHRQHKRTNFKETRQTRAGREDQTK